jgi:hypothetical protein
MYGVVHVCVFSHPNKLEEVTPGTILLLRDALLLSLVCVARQRVCIVYVRCGRGTAGEYTKYILHFRASLYGSSAFRTTAAMTYLLRAADNLYERSACMHALCAIALSRRGDEFAAAGD